MGSVYIKNANIVLPCNIHSGALLKICGDKISAIGNSGKPLKGSRVIDARGCFVSPGFIDTHIHGSPEKIFRNEIKHGTTSIVIALSCASLPQLYRQVDAIRACMDAGGSRGLNPGYRRGHFGRNILGIRLEGPYISVRKCGAQDARFIHKPDKGELISIINRCGPALKIMTIAPEVAGAISLVKTLKKNHIIASLGHSDATCKEAAAGIDAGITHATHLFNAMSGLYRSSLRGLRSRPKQSKKEIASGTSCPRNDVSVSDAVAAILSDKRVTAEIIADMVHVDSARFILAASVKGADKIIMVTDSITAEAPKGAWKEDGVYWLRKNVKAGSALTMIDAVKNAVTTGGLSLVDAVRLVTINPARLLGVEGRKGAIVVGKDADLVMFDNDFKVKMTMVRGRIMYKK